MSTPSGGSGDQISEAISNAVKSQLAGTGLAEQVSMLGEQGTASIQQQLLPDTVPQQPGLLSEQPVLQPGSIPQPVPGGLPATGSVPDASSQGQQPDPGSAHRDQQIIDRITEVINAKVPGGIKPGAETRQFEELKQKILSLPGVTPDSAASSNVLNFYIEGYQTNRRRAQAKAPKEGDVTISPTELAALVSQSSSATSPIKDSGYHMRITGGGITVFDRKETPVGSLKGSQTGGRAYVETIRVSGDHQGTGLSKFLLAAFCAYWQRQGATYIKLGTEDTSKGYWSEIGVTEGGNKPITELQQRFGTLGLKKVLQ